MDQHGDPLGLTGSYIGIGGRAFAVRPPSLREVLCANAALYAHRSEADAWDRAEADDLLREVVRGWLPDRMVGVLLSSATARDERFRVLSEAVHVGVETPEQEADEDATKRRARRRGWNGLIAEYRLLYRPADVLSEPWPFFVQQCAEIGRMRAVQKVQNVEWYATARSDKASVQKLYQQAGLWEPEEVPEQFRGEAGERWAAEKREETMRYRERRRAKLQWMAENRKN